MVMMKDFCLRVFLPASIALALFSAAGARAHSLRYFAQPPDLAGSQTPYGDNSEPERQQEFLNEYMAFWNKTEIGAGLLTKIQCPVLLVGGDRDSHVPPATVLEAAALIPDSRVCLVPDAGHAAFLDNFPISWLAIDQFIGK